MFLEVGVGRSPTCSHFTFRQNVKWGVRDSQKPFSCFHKERMAAVCAETAAVSKMQNRKNQLNQGGIGMKKHHTAGRIASVVSAAALAVSALGTLPSLPSLLSAKAAGLTGLDAKGITSQMVIGWNLGNTLDCSNTGLSVTAKPEKFAKAWGQPAPNEAQFQAVKDGGFNTVRIPTTWYEHLSWDEESQMYLVNDTWMDYVIIAII